MTTQDIEQFLTRDEARSTTARRIASLRACFTWAMRAGYCSTNPLNGLEPMRATRHLPRPIHSSQDRDLVMQAIMTAPKPYRLVLIVLRETGMRAGEVLALNLGDVTLDPGREGLHVREAKNGSERIVVLGPKATPKSLRGLRAHQRTLRGQPPSTPLFCSNRGTRLSYDALHYQWAQLCANAGLLNEHGKPRYTLHQLRHTRASELIEQGQRIEIVQRVLGHRDPRSTQGYAELNEMQVRAALEQQ
jgi:integrase/recombinase XerD